MNLVRCTLLSALLIGATDCTVFAKGIYQKPANTFGTLILSDNKRTPSAFEIITYTGVTDMGEGVFRVDGIVRGQEGTVERDWPVGTVLTHDVTTGSIDLLNVPIESKEPDYLVIYRNNSRGYSVLRHSDKRLVESAIPSNASAESFFATHDGGLILIGTNTVKKYTAAFSLEWEASGVGQSIYLEDDNYFYSKGDGNIVLLDKHNGAIIDTLPSPWGYSNTFESLVDSLGRVVTTTPSSIYVTDKSFNLIATVSTGEGLYNVEWGGGYIIEIPGIGYAHIGGLIYDYNLNLIDDISDHYAGYLLPIMAVTDSQLVFYRPNDGLFLTRWQSRETVWHKTDYGPSGVMADGEGKVLYANNKSLNMLVEVDIEDGSILATYPNSVKSGSRSVFVFPSSGEKKLYIKDLQFLDSFETPESVSVPDGRLLMETTSTEVGVVPSGKARIYYDGTGLKVKMDNQTIYPIANK